MTQFIKPGKAKTQLEKLSAKKTDQIREVLESNMEAYVDLEASVNALVTVLSTYITAITEDDPIKVLDWANHIKTAILDFNTMQTKGQNQYGK